MGLVELLLAGLTGGIGAKASELWFSFRKQKQHELNEQLEQAYGPLYFWVSLNESLFQLNNKIRGEYGEYFAHEWSDDEQTQNELRVHADAMINLGNEYIYQIVENNKQVLNILERSWHNIDQDDMPILLQFQTDWVRYQTEIKEQKGKNIPYLVKVKLGNISFMSPILIDRIKFKYENKRTRLQELSKLNWKVLFPFDRLGLKKKQST